MTEEKKSASLVKPLDSKKTEEEEQKEKKKKGLEKNQTEKQDEKKTPAVKEEKATQEITEKVEKKVKVQKKEEKEEKPIIIPQKFKSLVQEIESLSVLDLVELVKILEKKFNVTATPQTAVLPANSGASESGAEASVTEEKSVFNIELKAIGEKKIEVIKAVRDITGKGLKESKDLVDSVASGSQVLKENVKKEEAEELKKKLETAGATVELK